MFILRPKVSCITDKLSIVGWIPNEAEVASHERAGLPLHTFAMITPRTTARTSKIISNIALIKFFFIIFDPFVEFYTNVENCLKLFLFWLP